jgi:hypothetical protein
MRSFVLKLTDINRGSGTEIGATEDEYDFFLEALAVAASVSSMSFVDDYRLALAKGETVTYEALRVDRLITITEEN